MKENPFLPEGYKEKIEKIEAEKEEKEEVDTSEESAGYRFNFKKPYQKEEITEEQKKRNFKGLEKVKEAIRKAKPWRPQRKI